MRYFQVAGLSSFLLAAPILIPSAWAQAAPIAVTYQHEKTFRPVPMNAAIDAALAMPGFARRQTPGPDTMVLTTPGGWEYVDHRNKDHVRFMLVFTRDGDKIGESEEVCTVHQPYDCTQHIASDIKSAAAIAR
jgi:hypothetical protein